MPSGVAASSTSTMIPYAPSSSASCATRSGFGGAWTRHTVGASRSRKNAADRLVRGDHELLDELVGLLDRRIALGLDDVAHEARIVGVEHDLRLGELELERAARPALRAQHLRERVEPLELADPRPVLLAAAAEVAAERRRDAGVVEARLAADHRRGVADVDELGRRRCSRAARPSRSDRRAG